MGNYFITRSLYQDTNLALPCLFYLGFQAITAGTVVQFFLHPPPLQIPLLPYLGFSVVPCTAGTAVTYPPPPTPVNSVCNVPRFLCCPLHCQDSCQVTPPPPSPPPANFVSDVTWLPCCPLHCQDSCQVSPTPWEFHFCCTLVSLLSLALPGQLPKIFSWHFLWTAQLHTTTEIMNCSKFNFNS